MFKPSLLFILAFCCVFYSLEAQDKKKLKTSYEEVLAKCKDKPRDALTRVVVTRFNVTTRKSVPELGKNLSTMLTNAMQESNCFNVLENLSNKNDYLQELEVDDRYTDKKNTPKIGKWKGAQLVVTGEVTEYSLKNSKAGIIGVQTKKNTVQLGFILKMINPETREIIWSKSVNVEGKAGGGNSFGFNSPFGGRVTLTNVEKDNPALANALEHGVLESIELIVDNIDDLDLPTIEDLGLNNTKIIIAKADYMEMRSLESKIAGNTSVKSATKSLDSGIGYLNVKHEGSTEELLDAILDTISAKYDIVSVTDGEIGLKAK